MKPDIKEKQEALKAEIDKKWRRLHAWWRYTQKFRQEKKRELSIDPREEAINRKVEDMEKELVNLEYKMAKYKMLFTILE